MLSFMNFIDLPILAVNRRDSVMKITTLDANTEYISSATAFVDHLFAL